MKKAILLLAAALALATSTKADDNTHPKTIALTAEEKLLVEHNNDFAFNLFRRSRGASSMVLSPLSVTYALGMLANGADGPTLQEINQTLGFGNADATNNFCRKMLTECANLDPETKALISSTIFMNQPYELLPSFVEKARTFYDATPETRNFADGLTLDVINQWASDHTEGMIKQVISPTSFNPLAVSYLLNAIYFKGVWTQAFDPAQTRTEVFSTGEKVQMMHQYGTFEYTENELYRAVRLPYGNGTYEMSVFLPQQGKTLDDLLPHLNGTNWQQHGGIYDVDLKLPRFETDTDLTLNDIMQDLGMPSAFDFRKADFSQFCNAKTYIGKMKQVAKIKLDEQGTEAAAVTAIEVNTGSLPRTAQFLADHPFLYVISEHSTGAIFFIGQFMGDVTAGINAIPHPAANAQHPSPDTVHPTYNLNGQRVSTPAKGIFIHKGKKLLAK